MPELAITPLASPSFEGFDLQGWARRYAERFQIQALFRARGLINQAADSDTLEGEELLRQCPFSPDDLSHSCTCKDVSYEDFDFDADKGRSRTESERRDFKNKQQRAFIHCTHQDCQAWQPLQYLQQILESGWISLDDLQDPAFGGGPVLPEGFAVGEDGWGSDIYLTEAKHDQALERKVAAERSKPSNMRSEIKIKKLEKRIRDEAQTHYTRLSEYIRTEALTTNELGERLGLRLAYFAADGQLRYYDVTDAVMEGSGSALFAELTKIGVAVTSNSKLWPKLVQMLKDSETPRRVVLYATPGWHQLNRVFITPTGLVIRAEGFGTAWVTHALAPEAHLPQGASIDETKRAEWGKSVVAQIWKGDTDQFALAHLLGCAGVLSSLIDENFGLHFHGPTSIGKTSAQIIASACVADPEPKKGTLITADFKDNQVDRVRQRASGTCLHIDDVKTGKINLELLAYLGGSGTWKSPYSVSSELSLRQLVPQMQEGMSVRLLSLNFEQIAPIDPSRADAIKRAARSNYGTVLPPFVRQVMALGWHDTPALLRDEVDRIAAALSADTPPQRRARWLRAARAFAILRKAGDVLLAAQELPRGVGLADIERVVQWAWETYRLGAAEQDPLEASISALSEWLSQGGNVHPLHGSALNSPGPWTDGDTIFLPSGRLKSIPGVTVSLSALLKALKQRQQLLVPGSSGKNLTWSNVPGRGRLRHYRIRRLT